MRLFLLILLFCQLTLAEVRLEPIAGGFEKPIGIVHAGDHSGRLFIVTQGGVIHVMQDGHLDVFLDMSDMVIQTGAERGLLGLAFHPEFADNGYFFLNYMNLEHATVIARWQVSADGRVQPDSHTVLMSFEQPFSNHNGGHLAFGPDGYLYIASGDGGDGGDPRQYGQALYSPLGKILRIDIDGAEPYSIPADNPWAASPDAVKEIWSYGLRNPWRFSFDRLNGDMYIGDVGQDMYEEINLQPAGQAGLNFGWRTMEGFSCFNPENFREPLPDCDKSGLTPPILAYSHDEGRSVTGGYVYRGTELPWLYGAYLYGDFASGRIWQARQQDGVWQASLLLESGLNISSFGEDEAGELYLLDYGSGTLYRLSAP